MQSELVLENITKRFARVTANDAVNLEVRRGEVHALVGENGAGKSTLMNILYGLIRPDEGRVFYRGEEIRPRSPQDAIRAGIGMVHQHFMLAPSMTVAENIAAGRPPGGRFLWRESDLERALRPIRAFFDLSVPLSARVETLSVGQMQRVEIMKILYRGAGLIILDEPTATLTPPETQALFETVRRLTESGHTIIFISHRLPEITAISDRVTVLRGGRTVGTVETRSVESADIARMMIGRDVAQPAREATERGDVALKIRGLSVSERGARAVRDVSFDLRGGEIVGVAGVEGNGQTELAEAVIGVRRASAGDVEILDRDARRLTVRERMDMGFARIPQERMREGLALELSVAENLIPGRHDAPPLARFGITNGRAVKSAARDLIERFHIKTPSGEERAGNLSGGNMQKIIVARELSRDPKLVIACHPTRGVDIGSIEYIHRRLLDVRRGGGAVLLISADLDEILALSDRILVMFGGEIAGEMRREEATEARLGAYMFGLERKVAL